MHAETEPLRADVEALRAEVERLRQELAELREYIGEAPAMECGITTFDEWRLQRKRTPTR